MAKKGTFKCSQCGRVFAMAAHLGRHNATIHGARAVSRPGGRPAKVVPGRRGAGGPAHLLQELGAARADLAAQAATLYAQLTALDEALALLGGAKPRSAAPKARRGRKAAQPGTLREHVERVLRAQRGPMQVRDITAAVVRAGFKSRDKELTKSVGKCLVSMPGVVRVRRGTFRLR